MGRTWHAKLHVCQSQDIMWESRVLLAPCVPQIKLRPSDLMVVPLPSEPSFWLQSPLFPPRSDHVFVTLTYFGLGSEEGLSEHSLHVRVICSWRFPLASFILLAKRLFCGLLLFLTALFCRGTGLCCGIRGIRCSILAVLVLASRFLSELLTTWWKLPPLQRLKALESVDSFGFLLLENSSVGRSRKILLPVFGFTVAELRTLRLAPTMHLHTDLGFLSPVLLGP